MAKGSIYRSIPYAGLAALKAAAGVTPDSLGGKALRRKFANKLVEMRGVPMKMAQILSMTKDDNAASLHKEALAQVPIATAEDILKRITAYAPGLAGKIAVFSEKGIAASLGQVHKARLHDGRVCAIKMKHAGIGPAMDLDAGLMAFTVSVFGQFRQGFAVDAFQELLTGELRGELDYPYEASRQERLWNGFRNRTGIVIPRPYPAESGPDHLLMDWEASATVSEFAALASESEKVAATALLAEFHIRSIFHCGMVHADPNPGNFGLRRGADGLQLVVYDFGSAISLDERLTRGFLGLIDNVRQGRGVMPGLLAMGFLPEPLSAIADKLDALFGILLEPFVAKGGFRIDSWNRRDRVMDLLGAERWNLMVAAPPMVFFLMRAMHGLFHYTGILGGILNLEPLVAEEIAAVGSFPWTLEHDFRTTGIPAAHPNSNVTKNNMNLEPLLSGEIAESGSLPWTIGQDFKTTGIPAVHLRVKVTKNNSDSISVTLPADAVNRLEQVMDSELVLALRSDGIEVMDAMIAARKNGYAPMELFAWSGAGKTVRIWLE